MKDERRAWVPVSTFENGDVHSWWSCASQERARAMDKFLSITGYTSWERAYRNGVRMRRCTIEVPKGRKRR
jgi:hypothetical protein